MPAPRWEEKLSMVGNTLEGEKQEDLRGLKASRLLFSKRNEAEIDRARHQTPPQAYRHMHNSPHSTHMRTHVHTRVLTCIHVHFPHHTNTNAAATRHP